MTMTTRLWSPAVCHLPILNAATMISPRNRPRSGIALRQNLPPNSTATLPVPALSSPKRPPLAFLLQIARSAAAAATALPNSRRQTARDINGSKMSGTHREGDPESRVRLRRALFFLLCSISLLNAIVAGYDSRTLFVPKDAAKKFTPFEGQV